MACHFWVSQWLHWCALCYVVALCQLLDGMLVDVLFAFVACFHFHVWCCHRVFDVVVMMLEMRLLGANVLVHKMMQMLVLVVLSMADWSMLLAFVVVSPVVVLPVWWHLWLLVCPLVCWCSCLMFLAWVLEELKVGWNWVCMLVALLTMVCHWWCPWAVGHTCTAWPVVWWSLLWWLFLRCLCRILHWWCPFPSRCLWRICFQPLADVLMLLQPCTRWSRQIHRWESCCHSSIYESSWCVHPSEWMRYVLTRKALCLITHGVMGCFMVMLML